MNKNTKKALLLGGIAAAGVGFWYFFLGPGAAPSATSSSTSSASAGPPPWTLAANAQKAAIIEGWIASFPATQALNQAQWTKYMETMASQQDIDVMSDLIVNYWALNVAPSYSQDNYFTALTTTVGKITIP